MMCNNKFHRLKSIVIFNRKLQHCVFCENNNEPEYVYQTHPLRDAAGRILCPRLRNYVCPACGACGDNAHTLRYCENRPIVTVDDTVKMDLSRRINAKYCAYQKMNNNNSYSRNSNNIRL